MYMVMEQGKFFWQLFEHRISERERREVEQTKYEHIFGDEEIITIFPLKMTWKR